MGSSGKLKGSAKDNKPRPAASAITDPRFEAVQWDPRFQRFPKKGRHVEIDKRFEGKCLCGLLLFECSSTSMQDHPIRDVHYCNKSNVGRHVQKPRVSAAWHCGQARPEDGQTQEPGRHEEVLQAQR